MLVAGPVVVGAAFVEVAAVVAWQRNLVAVVALRMHLVVRIVAVAVVVTAGFETVAGQLSGKDSRRSPSVVVGPVAEAGGHNRQIQHR